MQPVVRYSKTFSGLLAAALMAACSLPNIPPAAAVVNPPAAMAAPTNAAVAAAPQAPSAPAAQSEEELLHALFERVAPSVVYINVTQRSNANGFDLLQPTDQP